MAESRASSPASLASPRLRVGTFSLESIPMKWDNEATIRERIRENRNLCLAYDETTGETTSTFVEATISNLKLNAAVLKPLVGLMKDNDRQLPAIGALISAVEEFFVIAKLARTSEQCYQEGWSIRRLIVKLKKFTYRPWPPQDCRSATNLAVDISKSIWCSTIYTHLLPDIYAFGSFPWSAHMEFTFRIYLLCMHHII